MELCTEIQNFGTTPSTISIDVAPHPDYLMCQVHPPAVSASMGNPPDLWPPLPALHHLLPDAAIHSGLQ